MLEITIRDARVEDASSLAGLSRTLGYPASTEEVLARLLPILASENDCALVACVSDGSVVAWVHVFLTHRIETDRFAELGGLVVAEDQRGEGIGASLMAAAEDWAIDHGVNRIRVRSRSTRVIAHSFYQGLGFTRIKEQGVFEKTLKRGETES
jgi:GNAT superfamily N-acetyltransferase